MLNFTRLFYGGGPCRVGHQIPDVRVKLADITGQATHRRGQLRRFGHLVSSRPGLLVQLQAGDVGLGPDYGGQLSRHQGGVCAFLGRLKDLHLQLFCEVL